MVFSPLFLGNLAVELDPVGPHPVRTVFLFGQEVGEPKARNTLWLPGPVNIQKAIENGHRTSVNSGFTHKRWWFSIVTYG